MSVKVILLVLIFYSISSMAQSIHYNQEFRVNTYTNSRQSEPSICTLSDGSFVVCWQSYGQDGSLLGIIAQLYDSSKTKDGEEFIVNTHTNDDQWSQSAIALSEGGFVVCWESWGQDGDGPGIFGQLFENNGEKRGDEFRINENTSGMQMFPAVCGLSDGGFVVCWENESFEYNNSGVYAQIYDDNGAKRGGEFQITDFLSSYQQYITVTGLSEGRFTIFWHAPDGDNLGIFGQIYNNGGTKEGGEFQVNTYITDNQSYPRVCTLTDGRFVVCWLSYGQDGDRSGIFGQIYEDDGTKQGEEFQINSYAKGYQSVQAITQLSDDRFIVCWISERQDGSGSGVYGQIYDKYGQKFGKEFRINTYVENDQTWPCVSGLSNGGFIACWQSFGQDGSGDGIYGKYFLKNPILHSLQSFSLISPIFDSISNLTTVNFRWSKASSTHINLPWELEYTFYLGSSEDLSDPQIFSDISDTTFTVKELTPSETYFWKVLVKNIAGDSLWSLETFGFYISPTADIEDAMIQKPETFKLFPNYPNPFNPRTIISYELPITNDVEVNIYNLRGQKVVNLISEKQNAGNHHVEWDASQYSSGVYFLILEADNFKASQKMLLVK